jgi:hypothetical protein
MKHPHVHKSQFLSSSGKPQHSIARTGIKIGWTTKWIRKEYGRKVEAKGIE